MSWTCSQQTCSQARPNSKSCRSPGTPIDLLARNTQLKSLVLDDGQARHTSSYVDELVRAKLLAFAMGFHRRLGESSLLRVLGSVRGDGDSAAVCDLPLFRFIGNDVLDPASRQHYLSKI